MFKVKFKFSNQTLFILILILSGFIIYFNALQNKLFWDDNDNILNNVYIKNWKYFPKYFTENLIAGAGLLSNYWRPLLLTIYSIEWHLWKGNAFYYHLFNVTVHIANSILLFFFLKKLFKNEILAFLTALIFLVHPLQTESVTYVSGLGGPFSFLLILLGLLFYIETLKDKKIFQNWKYYFSIIFFTLSLLTREEAVIAPLLFTLVGIFIYKKQSNKNLKKLLLIILPFFLILLIYILLRLKILNFENIANYYPQSFSQNIFIRIITFLRIFLIYLSLIFFPKDLHMERSINISENITFDVICGLVIISFFLIISILEFKKHPILSFGILWFLISLSIHSNVLVIKSSLLYEHWLYIPLFGIFLALFYFLHQISKNKIFFQKILIAFYIVFVILLGIRTIIRNNDWKDPITFYTKTLKYAPSSYRVLNNLGMAYAEKGEFNEAKKYYLQAIEVNKKNPIAYHNLANVFQEEKNFEEAEKLYQKAISLDENFYPAYSGLLKLYINFQKDKAIQELIKKYKKLIKN